MNITINGTSQIYDEDNVTDVPLTIGEADYVDVVICSVDHPSLCTLLRLGMHIHKVVDACCVYWLFRSDIFI